VAKAEAFNPGVNRTRPTHITLLLGNKKRHSGIFKFVCDRLVREIPDISLRVKKILYENGWVEPHHFTR
jgi:hypothetical protein